MDAHASSLYQKSEDIDILDIYRYPLDVSKPPQSHFLKSPPQKGKLVGSLITGNVSRFSVPEFIHALSRSLRTDLRQVV
jgi:hypothetical protein